MPSVPRKLSSGEYVKASWLNQLRDLVISITPRGDGKTTRVTTTSGGSTIVSNVRGKGGASGAGGGLTSVKLKEKVDYNRYTGDVYGNGTDADPTEEDATIRINVIATTETITNLNTIYAIYPAWKQKWAGEQQWTCQPEVAR